MTLTELITKCSPSIDGEVCDSMRKRLNKSYTGFVTACTINSKGEMGHTPIFYSIFYRRTRDDRGVLLNYCPWCGTKYEHGIAKVKEDGRNG